MARKTCSLLIVTLLALTGLLSCKEPSKPIKKLNILRASDLEPIQPDSATVTESATTTIAEPEMPGEEIEILEVPGFRGACDQSFAGISAGDLVTLRNDTQIRNYRLAGVSIPEEMRFDAHNQIRTWLDRRSVGLEIDESAPGIDPAIYVFVCPDGKMINEELVRQGLAVPAKGPFRRSEALKKASVEALTAGRGVWGRKAE